MRENLTLGRSGITDEDLWCTLKDVGLAARVQLMPGKLDALVDEAGTCFSGGERHRIALARVLLGSPSVILLDEPTVGLDPATEKSLLETVFRTAQGKTLILVTHHLQGVSHMDRVVFVEDGRIAMQGSPAELERTSERYRALIELDRGI